MTSTSASDDGLTFQILGASARDVYPPAPEERGAARPPPIYTITLFGATAAGKSVSLDVVGYEPYFYVEMPDDWTPAEIHTYQNYLLAAAGCTDPERSATSFKTERHRSFWDFTNNRLFTFLRVQARTKKLWTRLRDVTLNPELMIPTPIPLVTVRPRAPAGETVTLRVFEANIDPMLRFFHERELKPAGWATVPEGVWDESETGGTTAAIQAVCEWEYVSPAPPAVQLTIAPLRVMSWDIECTSSHGDFPLAIKTWRKPARELVTARMVDPGQVGEAITAAVLGDSASPISRVYLGPEGPREMAAGLGAVLAGWPALAHAISTEAEDAIDRAEALLNQHLPPPLGDPIIQIGCVLYVNGVAQRKDIFVLGSCTRLPTPPGGAPVHTHACATEAKLIRDWCKLIGELDPDIMVGYNIFGFDEKYLWDRADVNRCTGALASFSRFTGRKVELKEKELASSAMGDNKFYVITGDGRLHIDLLAYVRRNAVLDSYSLDNVTATFMSGAVIGAPTPTGETRAEDGVALWRIKTKSTKGTIPGRYIVIMDEENDLIGEKLEVVAVEPKALVVAMPDGGAALAEHGPPPCRWSQSKDDVSPKDIFRLHAGGPADRAKVAKYCFPEHEHQLLTNKGYLTLPQLEELWGENLNAPPADESLYLAGYDETTKQLVYERPNSLIINAYEENQDMVEFTEASYAEQWDESNPFGLKGTVLDTIKGVTNTHKDVRPTRVSLITTPGHDMYARYSYSKRGCMTTGRVPIPIPYKKIKAENLIGEDAPTAINLCGRVDGGLKGVGLPVDLIERFRLTTPEKKQAFLQLYGYWLGDGTLLFSHGRHDKPYLVAFMIVKEHDANWLSSIFDILEIAKEERIFSKPTTEYPIPTCEAGAPKRLRRQTQYTVGISNTEYTSLYHDEYRSKYYLKEETGASVHANTFASACASFLKGEVIPDELLSMPAVTYTGPEGIKSAKWMFDWVWGLSKNEARDILYGLHKADGSHYKGRALKTIFTSSARFRDEIERLAFHAGYSPYSKVCYLAGSIRGYTAEGKPVIANHTSWEVHYPEDKQFAEPTLKQSRGDIKAIKYSGRTWCVSMPSTFVVARRARTVAGVVSHASRPLIVGNCLQDCDLVIELLQKLEVLNNSIAMANVCWVPVEYIFTRGQGIKSESLVFYECRKEGQLIPVLPAPPRKAKDGPADTDCAIALLPEVVVNTDDNEGYEGAIVLNPLSGIYLDNDPVAALDFSSLYPSSIISENLSHDSLVWVKDYDMDGNYVQTKEGSDTYDNLPGWDYLEVEYDILRPDPAQAHKKHPDLIPSGKRVCRYAQPRDGSKSTLPKILMMLLKQRKVTRNLAAAETDEFRAALLDAQQLAYKLTANSLYGQLGSNTSKIRRKCVAASTTGHGRQQLLFSKACIERAYGPTAGDPRCEAIAVYGDTDSVFIAFRPRDPVTGERLTGRPAQEAAKALAEEAGHKISGALKPPHDFEFDKMFRCFCLLSKKRYVGDMTEGGLEDSDYHRKSMGIVMKRRDNAPIVKYVYGGAIEAILVRRDIRGAFDFVRTAARELLAGKFGLKRLTITKSLRAEYKAVPAHKILADRIGKRDPGNKPASNDRIPFVYVAPPRGKKAPENQGERIETPSYIVENGLKPDYVFYITNQIAKPVSQVFGLVVDQLPGVKRHQLEAVARAKDPVAAREALAEELLFGDLLSDARREASGVADIRSFFGAAAAKPTSSVATTTMTYLHV